MVKHLLDSNVVIALGDPGHVHHDAAQRWLSSNAGVATCAITELAFIRMTLRGAGEVADALAAIGIISARHGHEYWEDTIRPTVDSMRGVIGHRQVTDFHLVALARRHEGRLATFDNGLAAAHPDIVTLIES